MTHILRHKLRHC